MAGRYDHVVKYTVSAECMSPLHIGDGISDYGEILVHPVTGKPFLQAAGIRGAMRDLFEVLFGSTATEDLFGSMNAQDDSSSRIRVEDGAFATDHIPMEYRPRVAINKDTGSAGSSEKLGTGQNAGHKFYTEAIGTGAKFSFPVYLFGDEDEKLDTLMGYLYSKGLRLGGQKTNGYGDIAVKSVRKRIFDLRNKEDRKAWASEDSDKASDGVELSPDAAKDLSGEVAYMFTVTARTESVLQVRGLSVNTFGENAPDSENIQNAKGEFIIPGSSLKGAIRNRMEWIASYLEKAGTISDAKDLILSCFGQSGSSTEKPAAGSLIFYDTVVSKAGRKDQEYMHRRIHIDKFTGGVMHGGLFTEEDVAGDLKLSICVRKKKDADKFAGLLLMALRDLAAGEYNLGNGYSIGKGFLDVSLIEVEKMEENGTTIGKIQYEKGSARAENEQLLVSCLKALTEENR